MTAVRRLQRQSPLRDGVRTDAVLAEVRRSADVRPSRHRGAGRLDLDDAGLRQVVDVLVADGRLARSGRRLSVPGAAPPLDPVMSERIERLMAGLQSAGLAPPPVEAIAGRLGIPGGVIAELRASGRLVHVAPGIDYPADVWESVEDQLGRLAASGPLTVRRVRDGLRATRRHADAILAKRRADRAKRRGRRDSQAVR